MKKYIITIALLALGLTACSKVELQDTPEQTPETIAEAPVCYFNLPASIGDGTKALTLGENTATSLFEASDSVYVYIVGKGDNAGKIACGYDIVNHRMASLTLENINGSACDLSGALQFYSWDTDDNVHAYTPAAGDEVHLFYNMHGTLPPRPGNQNDYLQVAYLYDCQNGAKEGYSENPHHPGDPEYYSWGASHFGFAAAEMVITAVSGNTTDGFAMSLGKVGAPEDSRIRLKNMQSMFRQQLTFKDKNGDTVTPTLTDFVISTENDVTVYRYFPFDPDPDGVYEYDTIDMGPLNLSGDGNIYFALMFNEENKNEPLILTAEDADGNLYTCTKAAPASGFANGKYYHGNATLTWFGRKVNLSALSVDFTAQDGDILTGELSGDLALKIAAGATVTLADMTHHAGSGKNGITCLGSANIILAEDTENDLTRGADDAWAGIYIELGQTLTISGTGTLLASGGDTGSPGIGGYFMPNVVINGGIITATGGYSAAGIGAIPGEAFGNITINGGTVTAVGGVGAPGIGAPHDNGSCGSITIGSGIDKVVVRRGLEASNFFDGYSGRTVDGETWFTFTSSTTQFPNLNSTVSTTVETDDTWTLTQK